MENGRIEREKRRETEFIMQVADIISWSLGRFACFHKREVAVHACMRVCVCACMCTCVCVSVCVCVCVINSYPTI